MEAASGTGGCVIGLTAKSGLPEAVTKDAKNYLRILAEYGVSVVVLSPDKPARFSNGETFQPDAQGCLPGEVFSRLDGLLLTGGGDMHPRYFGQEIAGAEPESIDCLRDELELDLARRALVLDVPVFGICRGCQVLNVAAGGGMIQHLDGHRSPEESPRMHDVILHADSRLFQMVAGLIDRSTAGPAAMLAVNTYHHQGVDQANLAPLFVDTARAWPDEWLIEAYESPVHRWVVGVQWHPERTFELPQAHRRLWLGFLEAATQVRRRQRLSYAI
jgi:putative glutamine amidotransferase